MKPTNEQRFSVCERDDVLEMSLVGGNMSCEEDYTISRCEMPNKSQENDRVREYKIKEDSKLRDGISIFGQHYNSFAVVESSIELKDLMIKLETNIPTLQKSVELGQSIDNNNKILSQIKTLRNEYNQNIGPKIRSAKNNKEAIKVLNDFTKQTDTVSVESVNNLKKLSVKNINSTKLQAVITDAKSIDTSSFGKSSQDAFQKLMDGIEFKELKSISSDIKSPEELFQKLTKLNTSQFMNYFRKVVDGMKKFGKWLEDVLKKTVEVIEPMIKWSKSILNKIPFVQSFINFLDKIDIEKIVVSIKNSKWLGPILALPDMLSDACATGFSTLDYLEKDLYNDDDKKEIIDEYYKSWISLISGIVIFTIGLILATYTSLIAIVIYLVVVLLLAVFEWVYGKDFIAESYYEKVENLIESK